MIAIVDYGVGNLRSVEKAFEKLGFAAKITSDPAVIRRAKGVLLPGVGAFSAAADRLKSSGLTDEVIEAARDERPFLGICVGLQLLFEVSEEDGLHRGLGVIPGRVRLLPPDRKVPHMGWNEVNIQQEVPILEGIDSGSRFYFVHSYYPDPDENAVTATTTDYSITFTSSVATGNLFACQFHPEKSGTEGLRVLANFGRLVNPS